MNYHELGKKMRDYDEEVLYQIDLRAKKRLTKGQKFYRYGYMQGVDDSDTCMYADKLKQKYKCAPEAAEKLAKADIVKIAEYLENHGISYDVDDLIKDFSPKWLQHG